MNKRNIIDTSLVKVEPFIRPSTKIYLPTKSDLAKFKNADYLIDLTHKDSTITVGVTLPDEIRKHNIKIDELCWVVGSGIQTHPGRLGRNLSIQWWRENNWKDELVRNNLGTLRVSLSNQRHKTTCTTYTKTSLSAIGIPLEFIQHTLRV